MLPNPFSDLWNFFWITYDLQPNDFLLDLSNGEVGFLFKGSKSSGFSQNKVEDNN